MQYYSARKLKDGNGVVTGFDNIGKIGSQNPVSPGYEKLLGIETRFPKAKQLPSGKWTIVEDVDMKSKKESEEIELQQSRYTAIIVKNKLDQLHEDILNASNVSEFKAILIEMHKALKFLLKKELEQ